VKASKKIVEYLLPGDMIVWRVQGWVDLVVQSQGEFSVVITMLNSNEATIIPDYSTLGLLTANATLVRCE